MKKSNYLIFDIGGVLVYHIAALKKISHLLDVPEEKAIQIFKEYADEIDRGTLSWNEFETIFYKTLRPNVRLESPLVESFVNNFEKIQETQDFILEIKDQFKIGILSNMSSDVIQLIEQKNLIPNIDYAVKIISAKIGIIKPSREIFEYTESIIKTNPKDIWFIDDTKINIQAAKSFGWHTFQFETANPKESIHTFKSLILP